MTGYGMGAGLVVSLSWPTVPACGQEGGFLPSFLIEQEYADVARVDVLSAVRSLADCIIRMSEFNFR